MAEDLEDESHTVGHLDLIGFPGMPHPTPVVTHSSPMQGTVTRVSQLGLKTKLRQRKRSGAKHSLPSQHLEMGLRIHRGKISHPSTMGNTLPPNEVALERS